MKDNLIDLKIEYEKLELDRESYLDRARLSSYYTINYLILPDGFDKDSELTDLYQSVGSYGVNNLANQLLLTLLPPNKLFFNVDLKEETKVKLDEQNVVELENLLKKFEQNILTEINSTGIRNTIFNAITNLIVAGNSLLYIDDDSNVKNFTIEEYVIERDSYGNVLKIITKEIISKNALDPDLKELVDSENISTSEDSNDKTDLEEYDLFSCYILNDNGKYDSYQQISDSIIEDTIVELKKEDSPYIPLRWSVIRNESYGRSHVDLIIGDLKTLEEGSKTVVVSASIMSDIKFFVKPNSGINLRKLNDSDNGSFIAGDVNSVGALQVNKSYDLQILRETLIDIERRISKHFLLADGSQRDAERVTAEEIRMLANQLENTLGGVYSSLAEELQLPLVQTFIKILEKSKKIPKMPKEFVDLRVKTGIEALGRNNEVVILNTFLQQISVFGDAAISKMNIDEYIRRIGNNLGIDMVGLIKTKEQQSQENEQAELNQVMAQSTPGVTKELTKGMVDEKNMKTENELNDKK